MEKQQKAGKQGGEDNIFPTLFPCYIFYSSVCNPTLQIIGQFVHVHYED